MIYTMYSTVNVISYTSVNTSDYTYAYSISETDAIASETDII
jgi:hypothetical protein